MSFLGDVINEMVYQGKPPANSVPANRHLYGTQSRVMIHHEVQFQRVAGFEKRIWVSHSRIRQRYGGPVCCLAILGAESRGWRPDPPYGHFSMHDLALSLVKLRNTRSKQGYASPGGCSSYVQLRKLFIYIKSFSKPDLDLRPTLAMDEVGKVAKTARNAPGSGGRIRGTGRCG